MSPPGIVMLYASDESETALHEVAKESGWYSVGRFVMRRVTIMLDLTAVPEVPSIFEEIPETIEFNPRVVYPFLRHFSESIAKPVRTEDAPLEYVPSQIITEYVRSQTRHKGKPIDGIIYPSSVRPGHSCYVVFATRND